MFFFVSLYVQNILGYTPLQAGLSFLPISLIIGVSAVCAPNLIKKIGYKPILVVAPILISIALFWLAHIPLEGGRFWFDVFPGQALMALGMGFTIVSLTIAATTGIPARESGLASGLLSTSQQIGGALGLAILSSVAASTTSGFIALHPLPSEHMEAVVRGFQEALYTGSFFALLAAEAAYFLIKPAVMNGEVHASPPVV